MPIVDYGDEYDSIAAAPAINAARTPDEQASLSDPSMLATVGAAFRRENIIGSVLSSETFGMDPNEREDGFNPLTEIKGTPYEDRAMDVAGIFNRRYFEAWKTQVDRETEDRKITDSAGWMGTGATVLAGLLDLPTLIPGGAAVRGARGAYSIARSAASVAVAGGVGAATSEIGLQATQQTRTATESAVGVGGGIIFGGLLGSGVGGLMSALEKKAAVGAIETVRQAGRDGSSLSPIADEVEAYVRAQTGSVGAAVADSATLADLSVAGSATGAYAKSIAGLNPLLRALQSPSLVYRKTALGLMENPLYLKMNEAGEGVTAVETAQKRWDRGAYGASLQENNRIWQEGRAAGIGMNEEEFNRAVGRAMRRGDAGDNEYVTRAAKVWREKLVDPLKLGGQETGQLPKDLPTTGAESYFHRVYNQTKIRAQEATFKDTLRPWIEKNIDDAIRAKIADEGDAGDLDFLTPDDRKAYVDGILTDIIQKLTGVQVEEVPHGLVSVQQGPLKERTLKVPDRVLEPWLEDDVAVVNRRYARKMAADVETARRFGRADLKDQIQEVIDDYEKLKQGVTDEKELLRLNDRRDSDLTDMRAVRDMLRGNYAPEMNSTNFARIARVAQTFNYLRTMGGVTVGSLTDAVRPAMVHGMTRYMRDGLVPLIKNLKAVRLSVKDAKQAGLIAERVLQARMATYAEIVDPYTRSSPFERMLENVAGKFSNLTGLNHWTDFQETVSAVMTQNRVLENAERGFGAIKSGEQKYMAYLGLNEDLAARVAREFKSHGQNVDGIRVANTEEWTDEIARRAYLGAVVKDVNSIIVQKGIGDVPLFAQRPVGRALLQFKSFAIASNQRVLMRGMQEGPGKMMGGIAGMTAAGAFIYWLKQIESGRDVSNNPGTWVAEGLDRSGIFSIGFEINNAVEKAGGPGVYSALSKLGQAVAPGADAKQPASRFATRGVVEGFLGPTVGLANDLVSAASIPLKAANGEGDLAPSDIQTLRRLTPYASLPYWRWLIDGGFGFEYGAVPLLKDQVQ